MAGQYNNKTMLRLLSDSADPELARIAELIMKMDTSKNPFFEARLV